MQILMICFGTKENGFGHLSRSRYLTKTFLNRDIDVIKVQNQNPFKENSVKILPINDLESFLDNITQKSYFHVADKIFLDIPYYDSLSLDSFFTSVRKEVEITIMDYFNYNSQNVTNIINLYNHYEENYDILSIKQPRIYSGITFAIIKEEIINKKRETRDFLLITNKKIEIIISCGATDPKNNAQIALDLCQKLAANGFTLNVSLINSDIPFPSSSRIHIEHLEFPKNFSEILSKSDVAFLSGGTTVLEAIFLGTPIVVFPQNKFESNFFEYLASKKLLTIYNNLDINSFFTQQSLRFMSRIQKTCLDGRGVERIANIVEGEESK